MSGTTATKRQTSKSGAKQSDQGQQTGQAEHATIDELERQQRELEQAIEAKREKERAVAWQTLSEALPKAAANQPFDSEAVQSALQSLGMSLDDFKSDATSAKRALDDPAARELESLGLDDRQLSAHIKQLQLDAQENLRKARCEAGRLRSLVMQRAHRRQSLRSLRAKGYAIDVR